MKIKAEPVYATRLIVRPVSDIARARTVHLRFPLDMLRHDACVPDSSSDASALGQDTFDVGQQVILRRFSRGTRATARRWESFGWEVVLETLPDGTPLPDSWRTIG